MRIAIITTQYAKIGGVENVVRALGKRLKERGHSVYLVVRDRPQNAANFEEFYESVILLKRSGSYAGYLNESRRIFKKLKDEVDVFHFHNWSTILPTIGLGLKSVLTFHGTNFVDSMVKGNYVELPFYMSVEGLACSMADRITSVARHHTKYLITWKPVSTIYNGVKIEPVSIKTKKSKIWLLYVGHLVEDKGVDKLVRCLPYLEENVKLTVIGDGPMRAHLEELASENASGSVVRFLGYLDHKDVKKHYKRNDVFVLPSESEGLPLCVLESLSYGLPVIASAVGGLPEVIKEGETGYLLRRGAGPEDFAERINLFIKNRDILRRIGENARAFAIKNLNVEDMVSKYLLEYEKAIE